MKQYFKDIFLSIWTVLIGMKVTFRHLFTPAVTIQYPDVKLKLPERARNRLHAVSQDESSRQMRSVLEAIANPRRFLSRLAIRSGDRTIFVAVEDVEWIEAAQNYVSVHAGEAAHLLHVPMNTIEASLDPEQFVRIHRSYLVNVRRVRQLWTLAHGQYVLELGSGVRLQSGRTYGEKLRRMMSNPF